MAYVDYWHCAVCDGKAFYDADISWEYQYVGKSPQGEYNGPLNNPPYRHGCSVVALCEDCWKTHEIKVVKREGVV
jgi:hypothetical protein